MSDYPQFWNEIIKQMGLETFEGVESIRNILTFLGFTTAKSIARLRKPKDLNLFQIDVAKLSANAQFCENYPDLRTWRLERGSIGVLKDVADAAFLITVNSNESTKSTWMETAQKKVFADCSRVN